VPFDEKVSHVQAQLEVLNRRVQVCRSILQHDLDLYKSNEKLETAWKDSAAAKKEIVKLEERIAVAEEESNSWWKAKLKVEEEEKKRSIKETAEAAKSAFKVEEGTSVVDTGEAIESTARKVPIADVSDDVATKPAALKVNPRTRFITELRHHVKEATAMAAQTEDSDKALDYHMRVYKAKTTDESYKYTQEHKKDMEHKSELDAEFEKKRVELDAKKAQRKKAEEEDKERRNREWEEKRKADARACVVEAREKLAAGFSLSAGEKLMIQEAEEEERRDKLRKAAEAADYKNDAEVLTNFNDDFLRSV